MSSVYSAPLYTPSGAALIASSDSRFRQQVTHRLNGRCRPVQHVTGGADALEKLESGSWRVLFLDRRLPDLDPEEVQNIIARRFPATQVILLDSSEDPPKSEELTAIDNIACGTHSDQDTTPQEALSDEAVEPLPGMIGSSDGMQRVYRMVRLVAPRPTTVLIAGPTGTGKELVARGIHALSPRSSKAMVVVNCAAIPETLLESELFGYTRGAFTGAAQSQMGRIVAAQGGTLFLDEISELPLSMQAKLLRFLEQKEVQRLGSTEVSRVDVRVVAASNADLVARAAKGDFRQDLFYRLAAFPIELPTLSERTADIVPLAEYFLSCMAAAMQMPAQKLGAEAARILKTHSWPGNVRELQHVMERASILAENGDTILPEHLFLSPALNRACGAAPIS